MSPYREPGTKEEEPKMKPKFPRLFAAFLTWASTVLTGGIAHDHYSLHGATTFALAVVGVGGTVFGIGYMVAVCDEKAPA